MGDERGMGFEIVVIIVLVLINGLFAGAEIATVTVRATRIQQLIDDGHRRARAVAELRANPERFLATVQVGITFVSIGAAAYGGDTLAEELTPLIARAPFLARWSHEIAFGVVVTGLSYFSLVFGELVPKSLALRASETYALLIGRPFVALAHLARPVVWVLTQSSNLVLKVFGDRTSFTEARMSAHELITMLEEAGEAGAVHRGASEIATRAIELADLRASDVMVPRNEIVAIERGASVEELRAVLAKTPRARVPVYEGSLDDIAGVVSVAEMFQSAASGPIAPFVHAAVYVPEQMRAVDVLPELRARGAELAIVVDEHGGTAGLVTRADVAEELFGAETNLAPEEVLKRDADGSILVLGTALVRDVNRALELELPESGDWTTIGGMCVAVAGRIPTKGEVLTMERGAKVEIVDASARRVRAVRIRPTV